MICTQYFDCEPWTTEGTQLDGGRKVTVPVVVSLVSGVARQRETGEAGPVPILPGYCAPGTRGVQGNVDRVERYLIPNEQAV